MKVKLKNSIYAPRAEGSRKRVMLRGGTEQDLPDEFARDLVERGAAKSLGEEEDGEGAPEEFVELPARPSNSASTDTWRTYLGELETATAELGPLHVPDDAKRDDMIAIGDARLSAWNEE